MKKVIVLGSLNMDLTIACDLIPQAGETVEGNGFMTTPGGKGGNQAVAAARLGAPTCLIARVGRDWFGDQLLRSLRDYGVNCDWTAQSESLGTGVAIILRSKGDNRIVIHPGANHELTGEDVKAALKRMAQPGDLFTTQYECFQKTVHSSLFLARQMGLFTLFNPAPAKTIPPETYKNLDLLVVNQTECQFLTGIYPCDEKSCRSALEVFRERGAGAAIITLGSGGSVYGRGDEPLLVVESYPVPIVDTTAAGDTYIGALASSLVAGRAMRDSMVFATKAASLAITKCGAQQSIPSLSEVQQFFQEEQP